MFKQLTLVLWVGLSATAQARQDSHSPAAAHEPAVTQGAINPNGIFFNRFTGSLNGTEWFQTFPIAGTDRYRLADIFGGGFNATVTPAGQITLDSGVGTGSFSGPDNYVITPTIGGSTFTFTCNRVPRTLPDFPLMLEGARPSNPLLTGQWRNIQERINPETGTVTPLGEEILNLTAGTTTLRLTDPGGMYFQGVYENGNTVLFRRIEPNPSDPRFASFPGSSLDLQQNLVGLVVFHNINHFEGFFMLQTRAPLGSQIQSYFHYSATRVNPLAAGDINGDGFVDQTDRSLLVAQLGLTVEDDDYNLAADLDLDNDVDDADLALFDSGELIFTTGFEDDDVLLAQVGQGTSGSIPEETDEQIQRQQNRYPRDNTAGGPTA